MAYINGKEILFSPNVNISEGGGIREYDSDTEYNAGDLALYKDKIYKANVDCRNIRPNSQADKDLGTWKELITAESLGFPFPNGILQPVMQSYKAWAGEKAKDTPYIIPTDFYGVIFVNSYSHSLSFTYTRLSGAVETQTLTASLMVIIKQKQYYEDQYQSLIQDRLDVIALDRNASLFENLFSFKNFNGKAFSDITITKIDGVPNIIAIPMNTKPLAD